MMHVQQLYHSLSKSSEVVAVQGITIRHFEDATDIGRWVKLMDIAFKNLNPPMRPWTEADFKMRIMEQPGWSPAHLFFACNQENQVTGSVSLTFRRRGKDSLPALHLLAVRPEWRRQGIARMLVAHLEAAIREMGFHEVCLETHTGWHEACFFYAALGYKLRHIVTN
jgi:predicted N-acetyltransferase YhbS